MQIRREHASVPVCVCVQSIIVKRMVEIIFTVDFIKKILSETFRMTFGKKKKTSDISSECTTYDGERSEIGRALRNGNRLAGLPSQFRDVVANANNV